MKVTTPCILWSPSQGADTTIDSVLQAATVDTLV